MATTFPSRSTRSRPRRSPAAALDNARIAALLAREAEEASGHVVQALKRAAREAFLWPEEATDLLAQGRSLTELGGIGPHLAKRITAWIEAPPPEEKVPPIQAEFLTLARARKVLAERPDWLANLKGDLQMHTTWSDGSGSVAEMALAGLARGYEYVAITDHTKGLKIASGLNEEELAEQGKEIAAVNQELARHGKNFTVMRSTEVNLSPAGEVDMDASTLKELDVVLGSFHSALRKTEDQTARYLAAIRNPLIQTLGHPQGRVYNYRLGLSADWARVFGEAARLDKAVEIDGYADRQDLKVSLLKIVKREGARVSLGTDAHHPWQLGYIELSLAAACLAKIPAARIINFLSADELRAWVGAVRARGHADALSGG